MKLVAERGLQTVSESGYQCQAAKALSCSLAMLSGRAIDMFFRPSFSANLRCFGKLRGPRCHNEKKPHAKCRWNNVVKKFRAGAIPRARSLGGRSSRGSRLCSLPGAPIISRNRFEDYVPERITTPTHSMVYKGQRENLSRCVPKKIPK